MVEFNKMFVMLPVMLAARKIDGEDPAMIFLLRCVYGAVQTIAVMVVFFVYYKANVASKDKANDVHIFVPPPPQPFSDPNAKTKYQEKVLREHLITTARGLIGSTLFGILMTTGLHLWKGMIVGLAIQSVMCPFNLAENALVSAIFLRGGLGNLKTKKIFGEKHRHEMTADDEVVDGEGNKVVLRPPVASKGSTKGKEEKSLEDVLLDTWDLGSDADIKPLMDILTKKNINFATSENGWTPIMIMSGLGAKSVPSAMRQLKALGANPSVLDKEGWNALHWAAFHGSPDAAKVLLAKSDYDGVALGLHTVTDKEGKTALAHAEHEGNTEVVKVIQAAEPVDLDVASTGEGLKKRK